MSEIVNVPMHEQRDIQTVTVEIRQLHRQGQELALRFIVEIGRRLKEAKEMLGHGEWGQWVKEELPFSQSTAGNFMRIFEEYGADQTSLFGEVKSQALANLSYTKALRLLAIEDEEEREAFVEAHDMDTMSTRELEQALRERDEALRRAEASEGRMLEAETTAASDRAALRNAIDALEKAKADADVQRARAEAALENLSTAQGSAMAETNALQEQLKAAQDEITKAQEEAAKAKEAAKKAKEKLKAAQEKGTELQAEELEKIRAQEAARAEEAVRAAEAKAEELRRKLAVADPDTAVFGVTFDAVQRNFEELGDIHARIRERDAEKAAKLKKAVQSILAGFSERIGKEW